MALAEVRRETVFEGCREADLFGQRVVLRSEEIETNNGSSKRRFCIEDKQDLRLPRNAEYWFIPAQDPQNPDRKTLSGKDEVIIEVPLQRY